MIRADRMKNINFEIIEMAHSFEFAAYKAIAKTKGPFFFFRGNQWKPLLLEFFVRKIQPTEPVIANTEMLKKQNKKRGPQVELVFSHGFTFDLFIVLDQTNDYVSSSVSSPSLINVPIVLMAEVIRLAERTRSQIVPYNKILNSRARTITLHRTEITYVH